MTKPCAQTLRLEGKLVGPWVREAEKCWQPPGGRSGPVPCLDLTGITLIDQAGKAFLSRAHAQGAKFIACGCMMRAIVAEVTHAENSASPVDHGRPQTTHG